MRLTVFLFFVAVVGVRAALAASAADFAGAWHGTVTAPQGPLEIGFRFTPLPGDKIDFALHMPSMHVYDAAIGPYAGQKDGTLTVAMLDIAVRLDGTKLTGTFGKAHLPLSLERGSDFSPRPAPTAEAAAPAPLWKYALGAPTFASPVVADGVAYVGARDGKFHAVHAADGSAAWVWSGPKRIDGRAALTADAVLFVDGQCDLVCLARTDGAHRWRVALHDAALAGGPAPDNPTFNRRAATPLITGDTVYVGSSDGGLYALDLATGARRWRFAAGAPIFSGVNRLADGTLLFGTMDGSVVRLDATGREVSRVKAGGAVVTTPIVIADRIVVGSRDYLLYAFELGSGAISWRYSYGFSWIESTPAVQGDVFYVGGSDWGRVSEFDARTGQPRWATSVGGMTWGTPLVTDETVFAGTVCQRGALITHRGGVVALDRRTGAIKWRLERTFPDDQMPFGGVPGSLALAGDRVLACGFDGQLIALPVR